MTHFWDIFILDTFEYLSFWNFFITALYFLLLWQSCNTLHIYLKHLIRVYLSGLSDSYNNFTSDFFLKIESDNVIALKTKLFIVKSLPKLLIIESSSKNLHIWSTFIESLAKTSYFFKFLYFIHLSLRAYKMFKEVVNVRLKPRAWIILPSMSLSSCRVYELSVTST